ncbi:BrnT family toxin [Labrys monachus]|uniref:Uncharacterized DUF497 family protein n=1 Tax=Labrys monachus TaxID=217067 RepID=A0ABU0FBC6_9HYPH|nr:BrnT family toxin [Labrys monachus]MDQ0391917.1 uncharacterized DUF497 family protein [Labrys monachus]
MNEPAEFEWDDVKAAANRAKHHISFEFGVRIFEDANRIEFDASRPGDGEIRFKAVGLIQDRLFTVVFTLRGDVCRIISARRANAREERSYGDRPI